MNYLQNIITSFKNLQKTEKKNLTLLTFTFFLTLVSYPIFKATSTAFYLQAYGAKETPLANFLSIIVLVLVLIIYNKIQKRFWIQTLFAFTAVITIAIFSISLFCLNLAINDFAYVFFIWKEVYIVFLIHMTWSYINNFLKLNNAKIFFGPMAAAGSIGGMCGGFITSVSSIKFGPYFTSIIALSVLAITALIFYFTEKLATEKRDFQEKLSPFKSLKGIECYVFYIAIIIALSQICLTIINLDFNFWVAEAFQEVNTKAAYLGKIDFWVNVLSLLFKVILLPVLFLKFSNRAIQLFIPALYLLVTMMGFGAGSGAILSIVVVFVVYRGTDYSLFSVSKELFYSVLSPAQKYGAKYIADVFTYRFSKALISFFLIYFQNMLVLRFVVMACLVLWFFIVIRLFKSAPEVFQE